MGDWGQAVVARVTAGETVSGGGLSRLFLLLCWRPFSSPALQPLSSEIQA